MENFIVFGRGELCIFTIKHLYENNKNIIFVPDLPEPKWQESVVQYCKNNNIKIINFENIEKNIQKNSIGVSIYYRKIFKNNLIQKFTYFVNLHNGPLPKYRGVNPINWALKNNEIEHGVTMHHIDTGIDTGDIIDQELFDINQAMEVKDVYNLCIEAGKRIIKRSLLNVETIVPKKQNNEKALYYSNKDFELLGERKYFTRIESI